MLLMEECTNQMQVSLEEAKEFLELKRSGAGTVANATSMCILSPVVLIVFATIADDKVISISEALAVGIGCVFLFGLIATAVYLFIMYGIRESHLEYLEKDSFEINGEISRMVQEKRKSYEPEFARGIAGGVVFCILSVVPLILAGLAEAPDYICGIFVGVLLFLIAIGVNWIIRVNVVKGSYDALLQEGDFSVETKRLKRKTNIFSSTYWCFATAIYLGWSFWSMRWDLSWMIWPIAGILYAALLGIAKMVFENEK